MTNVQWTTEELAVLRLYYRDSPTRDICEMTGKTYSQVSQKAHKLRLKKSGRYVKDYLREANIISRKSIRESYPNVGKARNDWRIISERHAAGETVHSLAAEYGVSYGTMWRIINGKR